MIYLRERAWLPLAGCLAAGLALGFGAGRVTAPRASAGGGAATDSVAVRDSVSYDSASAGNERTWFALDEARRVLGPTVVDAAMYVDGPGQRAIVALRRGAEPDTTEEHQYGVLLLAEVGGRYVPRELPLSVVNNFGWPIGGSVAASRIDGRPGDYVDTSRLWGLEDVDGDGRTDVWAAEQWRSHLDDWELILRAHSPATGRTWEVTYEGAAEMDALPQPDSDVTRGTPARVRDWLRERAVQLATPLITRPIDWEQGQPWGDAYSYLEGRERDEFRAGPVPRIDFPYGADTVRYGSCDRDGFRYWGTDDAVWGDDVRRGVGFPVLVKMFDHHSPSMALGRRYLWIADDADARKGPSVIVYDTRERRLSSVPVPADRGCRPSGWCSAAD